MNQDLRERLRRAQQLLMAHNRGEIPPIALSSNTAQHSVPSKIDSDIEVPAPDGLKYFPFQRAGIEFLASRAAALLADEMGLGKSIQTAGLLNYLPVIKSCLIVCPASLKITWRRELERWLCNKAARTIMVCDGKTTSVEAADVIAIVNYDLLGRLHQCLAARSWDLIVLDEGHYLKNPKAQRTRAAKALALRARRKVILTGTPVLNRPSELWSLLNILDTARWPNFYRYAHRYCAPVRTQWGWDYSGAANLEELASILRSGLMLRRRKKQVLAQLPPILHQVIPLTVDPSPLLDQLTRRIGELYGFDPEYLPFEVDPKRVPFELISEFRRETGALKTSAAIAFIQEMADYTQKIVVFAHHHEVLQALHDALGDQSILVTGSTTLRARQEAIDAFQASEAPGFKYFIASTRAIGQGVTLTAASHVVFVEPDWTPALLDQAEMRLHRIGQDAASVLVQYLVLENSLDEKILAAIQAKRAVINQIVETQKAT